MTLDLLSFNYKYKSRHCSPLQHSQRWHRHTHLQNLELFEKCCEATSNVFCPSDCLRTLVKKWDTLMKAYGEVWKWAVQSSSSDDELQEGFDSSRTYIVSMMQSRLYLDNMSPMCTSCIYRHINPKQLLIITPEELLKSSTLTSKKFCNSFDPVQVLTRILRTILFHDAPTNSDNFYSFA
jgi:hypothetical protein